MLKSTLFFKIAALLGCMLIMLLPVQQLLDVVKERERYQNQVIDQVSSIHSRAQRIMAPVIVVPYTRNIIVELRNGEHQEAQQNGLRYILPDTLNVSGNPQVEARKVGLYQTQVYQGKLRFDAQFKNVSLTDLQQDKHVTLGRPYLAVYLSDARGIRYISPLKLDDADIGFEPGTLGNGRVQGIHAPVSPALLEKESFSAGFDLQLSGSRSLEVVPLGRSTEMSLSSNWPHPSFLGDFLPDERNVTAQGFDAKWRSTWFANNINDRFTDDADKLPFTSVPTFLVNLMEPVDHYQLTERSVKYAVLFIGLTFVAFFLFEMLTSLRVHPIQYLLVGAALSVFYLILLAFSERIGFRYAYLLAAVACCVLIGIYLSAVLRGWLRGIGFGAGLLTLYGVLYMLLQSTDNALMLGTALLFAILAAIMLLTRRIDWYQIAQGKGAQPAAEGAPEDERFRLWK